MNRIILGLFLLMLCGCGTVNYVNGPEHFSYTRLGSQTLNGLEVARNQNGFTTFNLKGNTADMGQMAQVIMNLVAVAATANGKPPLVP